MDREKYAIPRGLGGWGLVNRNRRRRVWSSIGVAARVYLCCQARRFGLFSEAESKARISIAPDRLTLCLGSCLEGKLDEADAGSIPAASTNFHWNFSHL